MRLRDFEELVRQALDELPIQFLERLDNVDVLVEGWPSDDVRRASGLGADETLYGLYQGVPLTDRGDYNLTLPDTITIFQGPIEEDCGTAAEVVEQVRDTVVHEIAHHFGISDEQLEAWGVA
jgi:predicted Zn-dependent protease with MMP-like domain